MEWREASTFCQDFLKCRLKHAVGHTVAKPSLFTGSWIFNIAISFIELVLISWETCTRSRIYMIEDALCYLDKSSNLGNKRYGLFEKDKDNIFFWHYPWFPFRGYFRQLILQMISRKDILRIFKDTVCDYLWGASFESIYQYILFITAELFEFYSVIFNPYFTLPCQFLWH